MKKYYPIDCPNLNVPNYWRTFRIGNLFWKFVAFTDLAKTGWTAKGISERLEEAGMIKVVKMQSISSDGRVWSAPEDRYYEINGKFPSKYAFRKMVQEGFLNERTPK